MRSNRTSHLAFALFALLLVFMQLGCSKAKGSNASTSAGRVSPTDPGPPETEYCSSAISYSGSTVTITGTARYNRRLHYTGFGLGSADPSASTRPGSTLPIRMAEVRVLDASGNVAQCATTDSSGSFSFVLPQSSSTYTVYVNSRASNSSLKASILNKPETNQFYSLTATVTAANNASVGTLTATANTDGEVLGAAFNILDQFLNANDYLRAQAGASQCTLAGCVPFTVAPKVSAYWTKGFNPNDYFGSTSGLSFYLPGYSRLFILGGISGDLNSSDTDHFDDSVIIHEYGHFLEDVMFKSDSPGGSHDGNSIIDPRLAWSEGWGNFIQAAVRGDARYIDTSGNIDGTASEFFNVNIETATSTDRDFPAVGATAEDEGNFREFMISRLLWDAIDNVADSRIYSIHVSGTPTATTFTDATPDKFSEIWTALTKTTNGFADNNLVFRSGGLLHLIQRNLNVYSGASDWTQIRGLNRQRGNMLEYGQYVSTSAGSCSLSITPTSISGDTGAYSSSSLYYNNDFYHLRITTAGTYTLQLSYNDADATGTVADLDLYLYNKSARFAVSSDLITYSRETPSSNASATNLETISLNLAAGDYMIDVNVYTGSGGGSAGKANYTLKLNGSTLCPDNLVPQ